MAILNKETFLNRIKERIGEDTSDDASDAPSSELPEAAELSASPLSEVSAPDCGFSGPS